MSRADYHLAGQAVVASVLGQPYNSISLSKTLSGPLTDEYLSGRLHELEPTDPDTCPLIGIAGMIAEDINDDGPDIDPIAWHDSYIDDLKWDEATAVSIVDRELIGEHLDIATVERTMCILWEHRSAVLRVAGWLERRMNESGCASVVSQRVNKLVG